MSDRSCEEYLISAMALADGEESPLEAGVVSAHLDACPDCRAEIAGRDRLEETLTGLGLPPERGDLWSPVSAALAREAAPNPRAHLLLVLAALFPVAKLADIIADLPLAHATRLVPIALAILFFACLRENPFRIDPAPAPEGDLS